MKSLAMEAIRSYTPEYEQGDGSKHELSAAVAVRGRGCQRPWLSAAVAVSGRGCQRPSAAVAVSGRGRWLKKPNTRPNAHL